VTIKKPEQRALMPSYRNPFGGEPEIRELERRYIEGDAKSLYPDTLACSAGAGIRAGSDLRGNVRKIFRWKLQTFLKRNWRWVAAFPDGIPDHDIEAAIRSAMVADADRPCTVVRALEAFVELPSVGMPVASAFLTWLYPRKFTVIDRQAYRALNVEFLTAFLRMSTCTTSASVSKRRPLSVLHFRRLIEHCGSWVANSAGAGSALHARPQRDKTD
jgi:hypothetical protein